eukprot:Gb_10437 [translate_table: standard]
MMSTLEVTSKEIFFFPTQGFSPPVYHGHQNLGTMPFQKLCQVPAIVMTGKHGGEDDLKILPKGEESIDPHMEYSTLWCGRVQRGAKKKKPGRRNFTGDEHGMQAARVELLLKIASMLSGWYCHKMRTECIKVLERILLQAHQVVLVKDKARELRAVDEDTKRTREWMYERRRVRQGTQKSRRVTN